MARQLMTMEQILSIEAIAVTDHPTIRAVSPTTWIKST